MFSLSIIIPAYNEEDSIRSAISENLTVLNDYSLDYEVVIINDGSSDRTRELVESVINTEPKITLFNKENGGFGSAIKFGVTKCSKEYILYVPVDSPLTKDVFDSFYSHLGKADVLVGYRRKRLGYTFRMNLNSVIFHKLVSLLFGMRLRDYNWLHAYKRSIFDNIEIQYQGIFMLAEVLIKAKRNKYSILEFPVDMIKRSGGVATAGSWRAAWKTFTDMVDFYFSRK